jgi:hypothetical protein
MKRKSPAWVLPVAIASGVLFLLVAGAGVAGVVYFTSSGSSGSSASVQKNRAKVWTRSELWTATQKKTYREMITMFGEPVFKDGFPEMSNNVRVTWLVQITDHGKSYSRVEFLFCQNAVAGIEEKN